MDQVFRLSRPETVFKSVSGELSSNLSGNCQETGVLSGNGLIPGRIASQAGISMDIIYWYSNSFHHF